MDSIGTRLLSKSRHEFTKPPVNRRFKSLKKYNSFVKVQKPDMTDPQRVYNVSDYDFRLKPGPPAIDAGETLPNINDDFAGRAPDLGAHELDKPIPVYGPRPVK